MIPAIAFFCGLGGALAGMAHLWPRDTYDERGNKVGLAVAAVVCFGIAACVGGNL